MERYKGINYDKHIWEGWTVKDFIQSLDIQLSMIQSGNSWQKPFTDKEALKKWCMENQPYYKKHISHVVKHFLKQYGIKS